MTDLTPAGEERRDHMLDALQQRVTTRRRRRRAAKAAGALAPVVALGVLAVIVYAPSPTTPLTDEPVVARAPAPATRTVSFERIGDDELLELLAEADVPGGLIRRAGVTTVAFQDPERKPTNPFAG